MGKLWLLLLSAAGGFVAAVAASPDDAERRAYDRGYAAATKAIQSEAVQNGLATWTLDEESGAPSNFHWASRHTRGRWSHDLSIHQPAVDSSKPAERRKKSTEKAEKENDAEAG